MSICPVCDYENIEGVEFCHQCQAPLTHDYLAAPDTAVERGLLDDHLDSLDPNPPVVVPPDMLVGDVLKMMVERRIGCVLIVSGDELKGIFSERDVLLKLNTEAAELADRPVSEFMTEKVETLDEKAKIAFAVQRMDVGSFRHVPIVDKAGKPVGMISVRDILRYITARAAEAS